MFLGIRLGLRCYLQLMNEVMSLPQKYMITMVNTREAARVFRWGKEAKENNVSKLK